MGRGLELQAVHARLEFARAWVEAATEEVARARRRLAAAERAVREREGVEDGEFSLA